MEYDTDRIPSNVRALARNNNKIGKSCSIEIHIDYITVEGGFPNWLCILGKAEQVQMVGRDVPAW